MWGDNGIVCKWWDGDPEIEKECLTFRRWLKVDGHRPWSLLIWTYIPYIDSAFITYRYNGRTYPIVNGPHINEWMTKVEDHIYTGQTHGVKSILPIELFEIVILSSSPFELSSSTLWFLPSPVESLSSRLLPTFVKFLMWLYEPLDLSCYLCGVSPLVSLPLTGLRWHHVDHLHHLPFTITNMIRFQN